MEKYSNILVYGQEFIGDSLFTTPFIKNLRSFYPKSKITVLTGKKGAQYPLENNPHIDELVSFDNNKQRVAFIKDKNFDIAFVLNTSFKSAWYVWRSRVRKRVGHRKEFRSLFLNHKLKFDSSIHYVDNYLNLLQNFKQKPVEKAKMEIFSKPEDGQKIMDLLKGASIDENDKLACIVPGTTNVKKSWSPDNFRRLAQMLKSINFKSLVVGSEKDRNLCEYINSKYNLCGLTSINELYALFKKVDLIISCDTGPMHIAACQKDEPYLVCLFGPTSPLLYGPYNYKNCSILRKESYKVNDICVDEVFEKIIFKFGLH